MAPSRLGLATRGVDIKVPLGNRRITFPVPVGPDFLGFAPDLPDDLGGMRALDEGTYGVKMGSEINGFPGESLSTPSGFEKVDEGTQPLNSGAAVLRLQSMFRTDEDGHIGSDALEDEYNLTLIAVTEGDGSTGGSAEYYRLDSAGAWTQIPYVAHNGYSGATEAKGTADGNDNMKSMPTSTVFPAGAPSHNPTASISGYGGSATTLGLPVTVITNNVDPVYVFPATEYDGGDTNRHSYTELHAGSLEPFKSIYCFSWQGRMFYINTEEAGSRFPLRIRWSALFDASPDPSKPGAGSFDIREFSGYGMRLENLDPFLVAYFSDGIVFMERTGLRQAPIGYRVVTDHRGLLGPHAVSHISPTQHFIIATDGFYILDSSGQFTELGIVNIEGISYRKWHNTFFRLLGTENAHRIQCHYDQVAGDVHIVFPDVTLGGLSHWIYDPRSERMWPQNYGIVDSPTCFTDHNDFLRAAIAWDSPDAPATWQDTTAFGGTTWASGSAKFGRSLLHHGSDTGNVYQHDRDLMLFDGQAQEWAVVTKRQPLGDVREHHCVNSVDVEFLNMGNIDPVTIAANAHDARGNTSSASKSVEQNAGILGQPTMSGITCRLAGGYGSVEISGRGEVSIRRWILNYRSSQSRLRF